MPPLLSSPGYAYAGSGFGASGSTYGNTDALAFGAGLLVSPDISNPYAPPNWLITNRIPIPVPTSGTNFSTEIAFRPYANNAHGSDVTVTDVRAGKFEAEQVAGTKWWYEILASNAGLPSTPPSPTTGNNTNAPTMNGGTGAAFPLMADGGVLVDAGPTTVANGANTNVCTNWIGLCIGVDSTCSAVSDTALVNNALNLQFTWSEA